MHLTCLIGRHWPAAAFRPWQEGPQTSHCADCGVAMHKGHDHGWRAPWAPTLLERLIAGLVPEDMPEQVPARAAQRERA
jgi:hypothetical protein